MDRHKLWRIVRTNYAQLEAEAPEGFEPVTEVYLAGLEAPLSVGQVQTSRDPDFPWVFFICNRSSENTDTNKAHPEDRIVLAHEANVLRVEISYRRKTAGTSIGFTYSADVEVDASDEPSDS